MKRQILSLAAVAMFATTAIAQPPEGLRHIIPVLDPVTVRWLAVAFVAEASWDGENDHRAIYHVLWNRWRRSRGAHPEFKHMIQAYIAMADPRTHRGKRVRWLRGLLQYRGGEPPEDWPHDDARWDKHERYWNDALTLARNCLLGRCSDPYKGQARHWGSETDKPQGCMVALPNMATRNVFYKVDCMDAGEP